MKKIIIFLHIIICQYGLTQNVVSPNVASLGEYALYPVSPFTGQANIEIPLTNVNHRGVNVPVTIQYNTKGNKVKEHPGFMGLGWTLKAGGAIIRVPNYSIDERNARDYDEHDFYKRDHLSYSKNTNLVARNYNNLNSIKSYAFDGGFQNGSHFQKIDANPDEFIFNFNGYSGVFYLTSDGIKIRPNGTYKLKAKILEVKTNLKETENQTGVKYPYIVPKAIYKIEIKDDKGYSYIFGGTNESIEVSNQRSDLIFKYGEAVSSNVLTNPYMKPYNEVNSWNLTEIKSPLGDIVKFRYERNGVIIIPRKTYYQTYQKTSQKINEKLFNFITVNDYDKNTYSYKKGTESTFHVVYPSYLKSIETPFDKVNFKYVEDKKSLHYRMSSYSNFMQYNPTILLPRSKWLKLDEISHTTYNKKIKFKYRDKSQARLRLQKVVYDYLSSKTSYQFKYDTKDLPVYESLSTDHWGYYNNNYQFHYPFYLNKRPSRYKMDAEILKEITNPLGGKQIITYEPHHYSKYATQFPFRVKDTLSNVMSGGLRIRSISANVSPSEKVLKKEYFYTFDYINRGVKSSGVLNGIPKYLYKEYVDQFKKFNRFLHTKYDRANMYREYFSSDQATQFNFTSGSHISYSEVTIKDESGYTVNTFTNHDNGFTDKSPSIIYGNLKTDRFVEKIISKDLFRGLVLKSSFFSRDKAIKKEIINEYHIDTLLTNSTPAYSESVPFIQKYVPLALLDYNAGRVSSGRIYTLPPVLKKKTTKTYFEGNTTINTVDSYTYGNRKFHSNIIKKESTNSKGEVLKTLYTYPTTGRLFDENRILPPLNIKTYKNNTRLNEQNTLYSSNHNSTNLYLPFKDQISKGHNTLEDKLIYHKYDNKGNPLEVSKKDGSKTYYVWGYKQTYLIAKIESYTDAELNNAQRAIMNAIVASNYDNSRCLDSENCTEKHLRDKLELIRNAFSNNSIAQVTTYTHDPLIGVTSISNPRGETVYYHYDNFNRLKNIKDAQGNILTEYKYYYKNH